MRAIEHAEDVAADAPRDVSAGRARFDVDLVGALDRVPTPFGIIGLDGTLEYVNASFAELIGADSAALLGSNWRAVVHEDDVSTCQEFISGALSGGSDRGSLRVRFVHVDGAPVWSILGAAVLRDDQQEPFGFIGHVQDISEEVRAQSSLVESDERHRVLFERLPVALYRTSPEGAIIEANPALAELLGYEDVESLKGLNARDAYVRDGEREEVASRMESDGVIHGHESQLRRVDGSIIWVRDTARVVHDGLGTYYEGALVEVTDRKRAELELVTRARQQEVLAALGRLALESADLDELFDVAVASLTEVFEADQSGILSIDDAGSFHFRASTVAAIRGHKAGDVGEGSLAWYAMQQTEPVIVTDLAADDRFETPTERTVREMRSALAVRIPTAGDRFGVIGSFSAEVGAFGAEAGFFIQSVANVLAAAVERSRARARLEQLVASKDEFIASVSHEVRTPLTVVSGLAQELAGQWKTLSEPDIDEFLSMIVDHSREMSFLIDDLLVAARADIGKVPIHTESVDLCVAAGHALAGLSPAAGATVTIVQSRVEALADQSRVRQIVRNLLTNAFRYGGDSITVRCGRAGHCVWLEVHDDGGGIPDEEVERIFDPYHRAHQAAGQPSSVGLGLTVSRKLARLMDGDLECIRDGGTTFRLVLPASTP